MLTWTQYSAIQGIHSRSTLTALKPVIGDACVDSTGGIVRGKVLQGGPFTFEQPIVASIVADRRKRLKIHAFRVCLLALQSTLCQSG
jgi:hypothetical protein